MSATVVNTNIELLDWCAREGALLVANERTKLHFKGNLADLCPFALIGALTLALLLAIPAHANLQYVAHTADFNPNDPGKVGSSPSDWQKYQWNFLASAGVNAPAAWSNVQAAGREGGRGVTIAVIDTGVAYRDFGRFRRAPDLPVSRFVRGYDFVSGDPYPLDQNGHGTHVAGTIFERTNNSRDLAGLAYGVKVMPIRALDSIGQGDADAIAAAIRFATSKGAKIINLSVQFDESVQSNDIPQILSAINFAYSKGVLVVAAAGNATLTQASLPARAPHVVAVGATTEDLCLGEYSNEGPDLVGPGGGASRVLPDDPQCRIGSSQERGIYQQSFSGNPRRFVLRSEVGTSMAAPHVSATAALVIASGVLGGNPTADQIEEQLKKTARDLGPPGFDRYYGAGLINAATATGQSAVAGIKSTGKSVAEGGK